MRSWPRTIGIGLSWAINNFLAHASYPTKTGTKTAKTNAVKSVNHQNLDTLW
jgi:hypothetical protein